MLFENKTIRAAIFDMDGTMFDTERLRLKMLKLASKEIAGVSMDDQLLMDSLGLSAVSAEKLAKERYGSSYPYQEIRRRADELEVESVRKNGIPIKKGLFGCLERLKKNGVLLAVATSSRRTIVEEYLLNANVMSYFDIIVCGDEVSQGKPNPEIFLKTAQKLNCDPAKCFIFEDSENGLLAASRAGACPILIKDLKEPRPEIKSLAYRSYQSMLEFVDALAGYTEEFPVPKLNEVFPQKFNDAQIGIHGFGAIGGGYLAQVFSYWDGYTRPVKIVGATRNKFTRTVVNTFGKYTVHYDDAAFDQTIDHIHLIDMDSEPEMKEMYAKSDIIGLCLPELAIPAQASMIAKGLLKRHWENGNDLTILIVLNRIGGGKYVEHLVKKALLSLTDPDTTDTIMAKTYFCESVVNRIVSKVPLDLQYKQVQMNIRTLNLPSGLISGSEIPSGPKNSKGQKKMNVPSVSVSKELKKTSKFVQKLSNINITLFNSGSLMTLYTDRQSPLLCHLRQIKAVDNISELQELKNKLSNGPHAIAAWYSSLLGYQTIGQGMGDRRVHELVEKLMKNEIKPTVLKLMPKIPEDAIDAFIDSFLQRCRNSFKDPCSRIGRDPLRKLQRHERIFGMIELAQSVHISTPLLEFGAAAALLYAITAQDKGGKECKLIQDLYEKGHSVRNILLYKGLYNGKPYNCLHEPEDNALIGRIEKKFNELKTQAAENGRL